MPYNIEFWFGKDLGLVPGIMISVAVICFCFFLVRGFRISSEIRSNLAAIYHGTFDRINNKCGMGFAIIFGTLFLGGMMLCVSMTMLLLAMLFFFGLWHLLLLYV